MSGRLLNERKVLPVMDSIYPMEQAAAAHQRMEDGEHIGKIVLDAG
jgi:NADPH:quinone reductase-like Zn-dependent oxidoreductase